MPKLSTSSKNEFKQGAEQLVRHCAYLKPGEKSYIIANPETEAVAEYVYTSVLEISPHCNLDIIPSAKIHGETVSQKVAQNMLDADVIFCLTSMSMAHTEARQSASKKGGRFLSLPDYSLEQLASPALLFDFLSVVEKAAELGDQLDKGKLIEIFTPLGTNLKLDISGRKANRCPGIVAQPGSLGSPPDAEVNIAPLEYASEGVIVIDGSIPCKEIGLLDNPVKLYIENGKITSAESLSGSVTHALDELFKSAGEKSKILAEFGIGLNPYAVLCGRMLEDEGCAGTVHFGFGSNATIGGLNKVSFHLDFIMRAAEVYVDNQLLIKHS